MGFLFGKREIDKQEGELLATCYRCGLKNRIKRMREVGYNVFLCYDCTGKSRNLNEGKKNGK